MSSCYYLVYMDELSNNKQLSNLGACVISTYIDNTSISDDPALVANVPPKHVYIRTRYIDVNSNTSTRLVYRRKQTTFQLV